MPRLSLVLGCGAILLSAGIGIASAADLGAPPPPPQAPAVYVPAPVFSWNGFYIGANAGYGWSNTSGTMTTAFGAETFSTSGNGFVGGGQAGFNYQWGGVVFGMEADFQGTSVSGTLADNGLLPLNATAKNPWFGTFRGRLGYAWDRVMLYATAGGVYGNETFNGTSNRTSFSNGATYVTWTAGAGVEVAFWGPLSAKAEYLYMGSPSNFPSIPLATGLSGSAHTNLVRAGINYHF